MDTKPGPDGADGNLLIFSARLKISRGPERWQSLSRQTLSKKANKQRNECLTPHDNYNSKCPARHYFCDCQIYSIAMFVHLLPRRRVPTSSWRSGHREQCAIKHRRVLEAMPVPENCKVSRHHPEIYPETNSCRHRCDVQNAEEGYECGRPTRDHPLLATAPTVLSWADSGPPEPTGSTFEFEEITLFRFSCFPCNFDLCESCITRKLGRSLLNPEPRVRTPLRETSSSRPRDSWCFGPAAANNGPMDPSAPPVHEEPPPSYQEAIKERE